MPRPSNFKREFESVLPFYADLLHRGPEFDRLFEVEDIYNRVEYPSLHALADEWEIVTESEATPYLPEPATRKITIGVKEQETVDLPVGGTLRLSDHIESRRGFVINLGFSVFGLEFVAKRPDVDSSPHTQYLAAAGFRGAENEHHLFSDFHPTGSYKNTIMIWRCECSIEKTAAEPVLDLCLLHDFGPIKEFKWCPYGVYEESADEGWPKLGILCIVCGDDTVRVLVVPHPEAVRESNNETDTSKTVFMRVINPRRTFHIPNMKPMTVAWGGTNQLTCGYTNGQVLNWDIRRALDTEMEEVNSIPQKYVLSVVQAHDSCVRSMVWHGLVDPVNYATAGNDGRIQIFDYRDPYVPMLLLRNRMMSYTMSWPGFSEALCLMDGDNILRAAATMLKPKSDVSVIGSKTAQNAGVTQAVAASELHPFVLIGNMDGWLKYANVHLLRKRSVSDLQNVVYKLNYDAKTKEFRYIDGIQPLKLEDVRKEPVSLYFVEGVASIRRCAWCPNRISGAWTASAGAAGLCRVDFVGRGPQWT